MNFKTYWIALFIIEIPIFLLDFSTLIFEHIIYEYFHFYTIYEILDILKYVEILALPIALLLYFKQPKSMRKKTKWMLFLIILCSLIRWNDYFILTILALILM